MVTAKSTAILAATMMALSVFVIPPANATAQGGWATAFPFSFIPASGTPVILIDVASNPGETHEFGEEQDLGPAHAESLHMYATATTDTAVSKVSIGSLDLPGSSQIYVKGLTAEARASCFDGASETYGNSTIEALFVGGAPITVTGEPNQVVTIPGGRLILNEQETFSDSDSTGVTASALHMILDTGDQILAAHAHAETGLCGLFGDPVVIDELVKDPPKTHTRHSVLDCVDPTFGVTNSHPQFVQTSYFNVEGGFICLYSEWTWACIAPSKTADGADITVTLTAFMTSGATDTVRVRCH